MPKYRAEIVYIERCGMTIEIEAGSEEEALKKFNQFHNRAGEIIDQDYVEEGDEEWVIDEKSIELVEDKKIENIP